MNEARESSRCCGDFCQAKTTEINRSSEQPKRVDTSHELSSWTPSVGCMFHFSTFHIRSNPTLCKLRKQRIYGADFPFRGLFQGAYICRPTAACRCRPAAGKVQQLRDKPTRGVKSSPLQPQHRDTSIRTWRDGIAAHRLFSGQCRSSIQTYQAASAAITSANTIGQWYRRQQLGAGRRGNSV